MMNEKMLELYRQAQVPHTAIDPSNNMPYETTTFSAEKFAELIVEECMSMCDELKVEYFNHRKNTMDFDEKHIYAEGESACFNLRFKMKKHFGVEE